MKTGLVLEGGAMRGVYTAGVLDTFLDNSITPDVIIGVSAGALFGIDFVSQQKGRTITYIKKYASDKKFMSLGSLVKTGNFINSEFAYKTIPDELVKFDYESFKNSGIEFYATLTNLLSGKDEYFLITDVKEQIDTLRASGSMPFVSRPINIDGELYLDGAVGDSIPISKIKEMGCDKVIVVLTKPKEYVRKKTSDALVKCFYGGYPEFSKSLLERYVKYNRTVKLLEEMDARGEIILIRPSINKMISRIEKDSEKLQDYYDLGVHDGEDIAPKLKLYLK